MATRESKRPQHSSVRRNIQRSRGPDLILGALLSVCVNAALADDTQRCAPAWTRWHMPDGGKSASLYAATALASDDVWAVGSYYDGSSDAALSQHWDGTGWHTIPMPRSGRAAYLTSISALSASSVWAVGSWTDAAGSARTLAAHWDGAAWNITASPSPGAIANYLAAVVALSEGDVWAVGYLVTDAGRYQTLGLHWNGSTWSVVTTPDPGTQDNLLEGVSASAPDDVWAAGFYEVTADSTQTLLAHWDGAVWNQTPSPNPGPSSNSLNSVHARTRTDAWAVGSFHDGHNNVSLTTHWDGTDWQLVASPNVADSGNVLNDVRATAPGAAWSVGYYYNTVGDRIQETLTLHWDGQVWSRLPSPNASPQSAFNYLQGVASLPDGDVWTVGLSPAASIVERLCAVRVLETGLDPVTATVPRGEAAVWVLPQDDVQAHEVVDATGMALYDSGVRAAGSSYSQRFDAAGGYAVRDSSNASVGMIRVPMLIAPASGGAQTSFSLTWSAVAAAPGFTFDVQIRRPGATVFQPWRIGAHSPGLHFVPDAGSGRYAFRARLRKLADGHHSSWSAPVSIEVS